MMERVAEPFQGEFRESKLDRKLFQWRSINSNRQRNEDA